MYLRLIILLLVTSISTISAEEKKVCKRSFEEFHKSHPEASVLHDDIEPPVLLFKKELQFPESLKKKKIELSTIAVETVVSDTGSIKDACIVISKIPELDLLVIDTVKQWKYKPALKDGQSIPVFVTITIRIDIR